VVRFVFWRRLPTTEPVLQTVRSYTIGSWGLLLGHPASLRFKPANATTISESVDEAVQLNTLAGIGIGQ